MIRCSQCKEMKTELHFDLVNMPKKSYRQSKCRECRNENLRKHRAEESGKPLRERKMPDRLLKWNERLCNICERIKNVNDFSIGRNVCKDCRNNLAKKVYKNRVEISTERKLT